MAMGKGKELFIGLPLICASCSEPKTVMCSLLDVTGGSHDPSDDASSHDTSSHDTTAEEKLRELYNCSFLVDGPSPAQLEGVTVWYSYYFIHFIAFILYQMFTIANPYMAKEAIQGTMPGQLSLYANQVVQVVLTFI